MIINTSLRTDIPAFFAPWFVNRLRSGYVLVRNPYNHQQVTKYLLNPSVVDLLVFCTKNPQPLLELLKSGDVLAPFKQFWFVTITPYGTEIEPNVPDKCHVIESFKQLSDKLGISSVCWRYDPVFISKKYDIDFHIKAFALREHAHELFVYVGGRKEHLDVAHRFYEKALPVLIEL